MSSEKLRVFLRLYLNYAVICALCLAYMVPAVLNITPTGKGIYDILSEGILTFLLGSSIHTLFRNFGLRMGESDPRVMEAAATHEALASEVAPHMDSLADFCAAEYAKVLRMERMRILAEESLTLRDCFDEDGHPIPYEPKYVRKKIFSPGFWAAFRFNRSETRRLKATLRAASLKLTPLSAGDLISESHRVGDPFRMGRSKRDFKAQSLRDGLLSKIMSSTIFSYYGVSLITDFSPADLMWRVFQVILFVAFGVLSQAMAVDYMTDEYRTRIQSKIAYLKQFRKTTEP